MGSSRILRIILLIGFGVLVISVVVNGINLVNGSFKAAQTSFIVPISIAGTIMLLGVVSGVVQSIREKSGVTTTGADLSMDQVVVVDQVIDATSMERFFSDIARERPKRFSPQQLQSFTQNYSQRLGSDGFGVVYKGIFPNGVQIAVKALQGNLDATVKEQFMAEVSTIGRTHHINLVKLYGFCFDPTMKALVYEFMGNGSLDKLLFSEKVTIGWQKLQEIAIGTAKGIAYLHEECEPRIIHYDIKPGNILLDTDFSPKVADFGMAKLLNRENTHITMTGARGTPGYAAPELWLSLSVSQKCDVYSFGMLLFEMVGRRRNVDVSEGESREWFPRWVWEKFEKDDLEETIERCGIQEEHRKKAKEMLMVALWCVQYSPEARPLMSGVVKMLEGGVEILAPPHPFSHLVSSGVAWSDSYSDTNETDGTTETLVKDEVPLLGTLPYRVNRTS